MFRVRGIKENSTNGKTVSYLNFTLSGSNSNSYTIESFCVKI